MRKISLDVDALEVESFDTSATRTEERGTVAGHGSYYSNCATGCESVSEVDCECVITSKVEDFTCYPGCM